MKPEGPEADLGVVLYFVREGQGWTQERLARAAGISHKIINNYERRARKLKRERLAWLLAFMGLPPERIDATLSCLGANRAAARQPREPLAESQQRKARVEEVVSRAGRLAEEYRVPAESSVEALLARDDVQAVVLATPDQDRHALTLRAAEAGKHVLAEKPMAPTVAECDGMIAACASAGGNLAVVKTERYRKITQKAKQLIDDGEIGPVWMVRTISSFPIEVTRELSESRRGWPTRAAAACSWASRPTTPTSSAG